MTKDFHARDRARARLMLAQEKLGLFARLDSNRIRQRHPRHAAGLWLYFLHSRAEAAHAAAACKQAEEHGQLSSREFGKGSGSGDRLSTAEWMRRRAKDISNRNGIKSNRGDV